MFFYRFGGHRKSMSLSWPVESIKVHLTLFLCKLTLNLVRLVLVGHTNENNALIICTLIFFSSKFRSFLELNAVSS